MRPRDASFSFSPSLNTLSLNHGSVLRQDPQIFFMFRCHSEVKDIKNREILQQGKWGCILHLLIMKRLYTGYKILVICLEGLETELFLIFSHKNISGCILRSSRWNNSKKYCSSTKKSLIKVMNVWVSKSLTAQVLLCKTAVPLPYPMNSCFTEETNF